MQGAAPTGSACYQNNLDVVTFAAAQRTLHDHLRMIHTCPLDPQTAIGKMLPRGETLDAIADA
ncbi:MAG: hypothetical protein EA377_13015 [Phycisphaerales bacterium]|nr:MAG: hypothetical protein EA377_13015 [Phycisphaerales bacterium]